ncbi:hypothetical protein L207DRAFT_562952 [Hyaloscypha variabilis F]|uniref:Zn(2)-C6 fungal-type domain-containing protein n=1 Tax=Hyaloscypha variabilis (strain UAMH 11265 / GT02V1 / F) TaxID=1149755 RepID=A0A2J6RZA2_HYAVF|nr:hypothetical protein L207DRAFT_562952 [Hyaloscypha variabilis F]
MAMASESMPNGIDLNDKSNLDLYFAIRSFKNDESRDELLLEDQGRPNRLKIHTIAESFNLEYEYFVSTNIVRISPITVHETCISVPEVMNFNTFYEDVAHWVPEHDNFDQVSTDFSGVDFAAADQETVEMASELPTAKDSCDLISDLVIPPSAFIQSSDILPQSEMSTAVDGSNYPTAQDMESMVSKLYREDSIIDAIVYPYPPYRCIFETCKALCFPSRAELCHHEQELHDMNTYDGSPTSEGCARAVPGYGFPNSKDPDDHIKHAHSSQLRSWSFPDPLLAKPWAVGFKTSEALGGSDGAHSDASDMSGVSGRSGRTGPLSDLARAGMKAVKKVGACWRCMFLRKKCDPKSPCLICPKGGKSNWEALGCHRGDFKTRMLPLQLCPVESLVHPITLSMNTNNYVQHKWGGRAISEERELWASNEPSLFDELPGSQDIRKGFFEEIERLCKWLPNPPDSVALQPLQHCTLCIIWEVLHTPESLRLLGDEGTVDNLLRLLPTAIVYQAKLESSDQLIAQSLVCLRSCLEVFRYRDLLLAEEHRSCHPSQCGCYVIDELHTNSTLYLDELSRVFFKKENLRDRAPSWLSIFYSFCIQSLVRNFLVNMIALPEVPKTKMAETAASQYLYLPLRLFNASNSGSKDRFGPDETTYPGANAEHYRQARRAVNYSEWISNGVETPSDYLKRLFQDNGCALKLNPEKPEDHESLEGLEIVKPKGKIRRRLNLRACDRCRAAKLKCLPSDREWPQKCNNCSKKKLECTEPQTNARKRGSSKSPAQKPLNPTATKSGYASSRGSSIGGSSMGSCSSLRYEITDWGDEADEGVSSLGVVDKEMRELLNMYSQHLD